MIIIHKSRFIIHFLSRVYSAYPSFNLDGRQATRRREKKRRIRRGVERMKNNAKAMIEKSGGTTCIRRVLASIRVFHCWLELLIALHLYATKRHRGKYILFNLAFRDDSFLATSIPPPAFSPSAICVTISFLWFRETGSCSHEPRIHLQLAGLWTQKLWVNFLFFFFFFYIYSLVSINLYPLLVYIHFLRIDEDNDDQISN